MTDQERSDLRQLCLDVTTGPWEVSHFRGEYDEAGGVIAHRGLLVATTWGGLRQASSAEEWKRYHADPRFIATARTFVPLLLDEVERLRQAITSVLPYLADAPHHVRVTLVNALEEAK